MLPCTFCHPGSMSVLIIMRIVGLFGIDDKYDNHDEGKKRLITPASIKQARETLNMEKDDRYVEDSDNLAVQIWIYHPCDKNHTLEVSTMMMRAR